MGRPCTHGDPRWRARIAWRFGGSNPRRQIRRPIGHHAHAPDEHHARTLDKHPVCAKRAPCACQMGTACAPDEHYTCARRIPCTQQSRALGRTNAHTRPHLCAYQGIYGTMELVQMKGEVYYEI